MNDLVPRLVGHRALEIRFRVVLQCTHKRRDMGGGISDTMGYEQNEPLYILRDFIPFSMYVYCNRDSIVCHCFQFFFLIDYLPSNRYISISTKNRYNEIRLKWTQMRLRTAVP